MIPLFGTVSSPSYANYTQRKTAERNQSEIVAEVIQYVKQNFYVDDLLTSSATAEKAVQMIRDLISPCQKRELDLDRDKLLVERALVLHWCVKTDSSHFKMVVKIPASQ